MNKLLIKFCTWYLSREWRKCNSKVIPSQAILNRRRNLDDHAEKSTY